jgi:hypothetical protein
MKTIMSLFCAAGILMVPASTPAAADHTKDPACIKCCKGDKDPKKCDECCKDKGKKCKDCCK